MKLVDVDIQNFRGIRSLHLPLNGLTVLIGENNTGKSTVLEAVRLLLTRSFGSKRGGLFTEYDFHLEDATSHPKTAQPIKIALHFAETGEDEWPDELIQQMDEVVQLDDGGSYHVRLQAEGVFNPDSSSFDTKWSFLDLGGMELSLKNTTPFNLIARFVPLFFLSALRDASREFDRRGQFRSGFLNSLQLPDDQRKQIEYLLNELNTSAIDADSGLPEVIGKITGAKPHVLPGSTDPVVSETIPTRVFDMLEKIQAHLKSAGGARLPLYRHGEGTKSLAVLMLFQAIAAVNLTEAYAPESTPILALEEPEAHLHPSAIRSLGSFLESMTGRILVSTHSGDLVSRVPVQSLRRLYKVDGETRLGQARKDLFDDRELQAVDYSIRLTRGHYLFSRCWLLVEGETEFHLMPLLFELMGYFQDQVGFSVLEISQVFQKGEPFIKFAKAMGIQWFMMADGDAEGLGYAKRARHFLEKGEKFTDRIRRLPHSDIEHEFWYGGYEDFMTGMVSDSRKNEIVKTAADDKEEEIRHLIRYGVRSTGGKPAFAQALVREIRRRGAHTIPPAIRDIINRVVLLAGG